MQLTVNLFNEEERAAAQKILDLFESADEAPADEPEEYTYLPDDEPVQEEEPAPEEPQEAAAEPVAEMPKATAPGQPKPDEETVNRSLADCGNLTRTLVRNKILTKQDVIDIMKEGYGIEHARELDQDGRNRFYAEMEEKLETVDA